MLPLFSIAQISERAAEKDYHFGTSGAFSNHGGHMARVRVLGEVGAPFILTKARQ
jgi:hypothetical protein